MPRGGRREGAGRPVGSRNLVKPAIPSTFLPPPAPGVRSAAEYLLSVVADASHLRRGCRRSQSRTEWRRLWLTLEPSAIFTMSRSRS
jgi:hypothetical protein